MISKNSIFFLLPLTLFCIVCAQPVDSENSLRTIDGRTISFGELDSTISRLMKKAGVTGLSCSIINNSRIIYKKAFGLKDARTGIENDEETIFSAASFSKTVFAYLVMLLVKKGIIDLDRPLQEYLDKPLHEYPNYADLEGETRAAGITARMVLSHSTGFPNWRFLTPEGKLKLLFDPGIGFSYSGEGIALLQMVVEEITGKHLEELSRELIFEPLGMERSSYTWQEKFEDNLAVPHDKYERPKKLRRRREAEAAGSMQTTAGDYAKFLVRLLRAEGDEIKIVQMMLEPQIKISSESMFGPGAWNDTDVNDPIHLSWALGWGIFNTEHGRAFFHTGHDLGWQNYTVTYLDKGIGVVLMSNSENFESIAREIVAGAIGDVRSPFDWLGYPRYDPSRSRVPPPEPEVVDVDPEILETYVGEYEYLNNRKLSVKSENVRLYTSDDGKEWDEMFAESEVRFFIKTGDVRFAFVKDEAGKVTGFILHIDGIELKGKKVK